MPAGRLAHDRQRYRGALLGLATGDAIGTTLEFRPRGSFECRAFNARDQMNRYCDWWSDGYMSSNGRCFDIGNTVATALRRYQLTDEPFSGSTDPRSAGNGSLMRLAPVVLFYHPDRDACVHFAAESSRTTHGAPEALDACRIFAQLLVSALDGHSKAEVLSAAAPVQASERLRTIAAGAYAARPVHEIRGTGYVVDAIEAALWCFARTSSFRDAVLAAANLGDDADTTSAICGQIAGAFYGASAIPDSWTGRLALREHIIALADALLEA